MRTNIENMTPTGGLAEFVFGCKPPTIIHEIDKERQEVFTDDPNTVADDSNEIFQDGTYQGPDPLQKFVPPVEEF